MWCYLDSAWEYFDLRHTLVGIQCFDLLSYVLFQALVGYLLAKGL